MRRSAQAGDLGINRFRRRDSAAGDVYRVIGDPPKGELSDLWLDPEWIGRGAGRMLFEHALRTARRRGFASLLIESDPNAEGFYVAMGATRIGDRVSSAERSLPLLRTSTLANAPNQQQRH